MRMKFIHLICIGFLTTWGNLHAQELKVVDVLKKATEFYHTQKHYHVDMEFSMYRGFTEKVKTESYTGTIERNGNFMKNSVLNTQIFQFPEAKVVVDNDAKTISYVFTDKTDFQDTPIDFKVLFDYFKESKVTDKGDILVCDMIADRNSFNVMPYGKIILVINKKDYRITKQELFFSNRIPFKSTKGNNTEYDFGKMIIEFSYDDNKTIELNQLSDFIMSGGSNTIQLNESFSDYQLINATEENN